VHTPGKGPDLTLIIKPRPLLPALATSSFYANRRAGVSGAPRRWARDGVTQFPCRLHPRCTASTPASSARQLHRLASCLRRCALRNLVCSQHHASLTDSRCRRAQRSTSQDGTAAAVSRTRPLRWRPLLSRPSGRCPATLHGRPSCCISSLGPTDAADAGDPIRAPQPGLRASLPRPPLRLASLSAPRRAA